MSTLKQRFHLPILVLAQFAGTSLWFVGNALLPALNQQVPLTASAISYITIAVQVGFILGTLLIALFGVSDKYSPAHLFFFACCMGALINLSLLFIPIGLLSLLIVRFLTGICLASIYPVGMKLVADWSENGLGKKLGFLVAALVLGTSFPYFLLALPQHLAWQSLLISTATMAFGAGLAVLYLGNGPYRKVNAQFSLAAFPIIFKDVRLKQPALGYFGHMWELYSFWAFIPLYISAYITKHQGVYFSTYSLSFATLGLGALACVLAGQLSQKIPAIKLAYGALTLSCLSCLLAPFMFYTSPSLFTCFMLIWGAAVIADSPLFSSNVALNAPAQYSGSILILVNSIGFGISVLSLLSFKLLAPYFAIEHLVSLLALGPIVSIYNYCKK